MLLFSVYIPTYNRATHLKEAIESVLKQSLTDFELLIIDDASTDNTKELVHSYQDNRIIYTQNKENLGCPASHNVALQKVKGKYIQPLDSDDLLHVDNLKEKEEKFRNDEKLGLIYTDALLIDVDGKVLCNSYWEDEGYHPYQGGLSNSMLADCGCMMINPAYRKNVVEKVGLQNISLDRAHDLDYRLRVAAESTVAYIDKPLYKWRMHDKGRHLTLSGHKNYLDRIAILKNIGVNYPSRISGSFNNICIANNFCQAGLYSVSNSQYLEARKFFLKAISVCPYHIPTIVWLMNTYLRIKVIWNYRHIKKILVKVLR